MSKSAVEVVEGVSLTLLPGTVVKFREDASLTVRGQILVLGAPTEHVVITSIRDDSVMETAMAMARPARPPAGTG